MQKNWIIAIVAAIIGLSFSVTDCSGGLFDSAEEESRAAAHLDTVQTDNQIRKDRARNDLVQERMAMFGPVGHSTMSPWWIIAGFFGGVVLVGGLVVLVIILRAALRPRNRIYPAFPQAQARRRTMVDASGNEYRLIPITDSRQLERRA